MTFLAVDDLGIHLFRNKPFRVKEVFNLWKDGTENPSIDITPKLFKTLYESGFINKSELKYKDEPIILNDVSIFLQ